MSPTHYLQERKKILLGQLVSIISMAGESYISKVKELFFDRHGLSPKTTQRYLGELQELNKIHMIMDDDLVYTRDCWQALQDKIKAVKKKKK